jgi:predicted RND superfamily exporter protein
MDEVGGTGHLVILVGPTSRPEDSLEKISSALKTVPNVSYSYYETERYLLKDKSLYLLPSNDFRKLRKNALVLFDKDANADLGLGLSTPEEKRAEAKNFFQKFKTETSPQQYFLSQDGQYALILVKPGFDSTDLAKSAELAEQVKAVIHTTVGSDFPFQLLGRYIEKVNDLKQFERDIALTGTVSLIGLALLLFIGLGSFRNAFIALAGVFISMGWAIGIAKNFVGSINILTGFLLAILGGLGVEYGSHLIKRYYLEIETGLPPDEAFENAYTKMGRSLFSAAWVSAGAFLILSFSDFRGFSELGVIAGFGILSIYTVFMLILPAFYRWPGIRQAPRKKLDPLKFFPFKSSWAPGLIPIILVVCFGVFRAEFEYDFDRMHDIAAETQKMKTLVDDLFGKALTPSALLATSGEQAAELEAWLKKDEHASIVGDVVSLNTVVPVDMEERYEKFPKMRNLVKKLSPLEVKNQTGIDSKDILRWLDEKPYTRSDLPPQLQHAFGKSGHIVLAYPKESLGHAKSLQRLADLFREAKLEFQGLKIGSDVVVFVEILDYITKDGKIILLVFLIALFFFFLLDYRNLKIALMLDLQMILGLIFLVGLMGLFKQRFTILNVAIIPAVLASGIDMGAHAFHRELEGRTPLESVRDIASAIHLSALNTIIGFGALFLASASMLRGIAWLAVLGQVSMYFVGMVVFPVFRSWILEKKEQHSQVLSEDIAQAE